MYYQIMINAKDFWSRVDEKNPYPTLMELAENSGCTYTKFRQQRVKQLLSKTDDVYAISRQLKVTVDYLLTGNPMPSIYSKRVERIATRCEVSATETQLFMIENILDLPTDYEVTKKKEGKVYASGSHSA